MGEQKRKRSQENGDRPRKRISIDAPDPTLAIPPVVKVAFLPKNDEWAPVIGMQYLDLNYKVDIICFRLANSMRSFYSRSFIVHRLTFSTISEAPQIYISPKSTEVSYN